MVRRNDIRVAQHRRRRRRRWYLYYKIVSAIIIIIVIVIITVVVVFVVVITNQGDRLASLGGGGGGDGVEIVRSDIRTKPYYQTIRGENYFRLKPWRPATGIQRVDYAIIVTRRVLGVSCIVMNYNNILYYSRSGIYNRRHMKYNIKQPTIV